MHSVNHNNDNKQNFSKLFLISIVCGSVFFIAAVFLFVIGQRFYKYNAFPVEGCKELNARWDYVTTEGESGTTMLPCRMELPIGVGIELWTDLPTEGIDDDTCLCILVGRDIKVYIDGKLRHEFDHEKAGFFSRSVKSFYSTINLTSADRGKEIRVVKAEANVNNGNLNDLYIGDAASIRDRIIRDNSFKFNAASMLFVLATLLFAVTIIINRIYGIKTVEFSALAFGTLIVSAWLMADSYMYQMTFGSIFVDGLISYLLTPLLPIPFFIYMDEIQDHRFHKAYTCAVAILVIDEIVVSVLHYTDIMIYERTLLFNDSIIIAAAFFLMGCIVKDIFIDHIVAYRSVATGIIVMIICSALEVMIINTGKIDYGGVFMIIGIYFMIGAALVHSVKRAIEFERTRRAAIEANIVKSNFLANMSHEIRTPINSIMGMNEMIIRETGESNIAEYADYIKRSGNLLLTIIGDVLDFSKIESGKLNLVKDDYETAVMLKDMSDFIHERARNKGLEAKVEIDDSMPSVLYGDVDRVKQILINLVTNAAKYTKEGSITFKAYAIKGGAVLATEAEDRKTGMMTDTVAETGGDVRDADQSNTDQSNTGQSNTDQSNTDQSTTDVSADRNRLKRGTCNMHFEVSDTGIGIKEEDIGRLFDAFARVDENKNRSIQGTGLGLAIVKSLTELMNGEITVTSTYGKGSVFHVWFPQEVSDPTPIGAGVNKEAEKKDNAKKGYKVSFTAPDADILAVDDNASNLMIIKHLLKKTMVRIDTKDGGEKAIEAAMNKKYDVILLDHMMPEPDGIEVFKRIRGDKGCPNISTPIIVLTANATNESRAQYMACGFDDYITKPVDGKKLEKVLMVFIPQEKQLKAD